MIYILGTSHDYQWKYSSTFNDQILTIISQYKIKCIAEEFSLEACEINNIRNSILFEIASEMKLKHLYCDPNPEERKLLGIPNAGTIKDIHGGIIKQHILDLKTNQIHENPEYFQRKKEIEPKLWPKRENEWIKRIITNCDINQNILMVIGKDHTKTFTNRLLELQINFELVESFKL